MITTKKTATEYTRIIPTKKKKKKSKKSVDPGVSDHAKERGAERKGLRKQKR